MRSRRRGFSVVGDFRCESRASVETWVDRVVVWIHDEFGTLASRGTPAAAAGWWPKRAEAAASVADRPGPQILCNVSESQDTAQTQLGVGDAAQ